MPDSTNQPAIDPQSLLTDDLFDLIGLKDASEEQKNQMMDTMLETVDNRVLVRVMDALDEAGQARFQEVLGQEDESVIEAFFKEHNLDLPSIAAEEFILYKAEVVEMVRQGQSPVSTEAN